MNVANLQLNLFSICVHVLSYVLFLFDFCSISDLLGLILVFIQSCGKYS